RGAGGGPGGQGPPAGRGVHRTDARRGEPRGGLVEREARQSRADGCNHRHLKRINRMSRAAPAPRDLSAATTAGHAVRMPRIGAHMSTAGGVSRAVERAALHGCETLQIFTRNANQWRGRPLEAAEIDRFRTLVAEHGLHPVVSHASYLINVASADPALRQQSMAALVDELARADALGLHGVVLH